MVFVTKVTVCELIFQVVSNCVSCHNFHSLHLCFNSRSRPGMSLFMSESVSLVVDNLYAEAIEAAKSRAGLSASTPELISILGNIKSKTRLWKRSQSVNFSIGSEVFLDPVCGILLVGDLSPKYQRQWHLTLWYFGGPQYLAHHHFPQENNEGELWCWNFEFSQVE
jgi:hypothetical protein